MACLPGLPKPTFDFMPPDVPRLRRSPEDFRAINTSITALLDELAPATLRPDVFLYYPIELLQQAYHPVLRPWEDKSPETLRIAQAYDHALSTLLDSGIVPLHRRCRDDPPSEPAIRWRPHLPDHARPEPMPSSTPAGCELPADCHPRRQHRAPAPHPRNFPRRLFHAGRSRIFKDNPNICSGVMHRDGHLLVTLVNLTPTLQTCHLQSHQHQSPHSLAPYQTLTVRLT